MRESFLKGIRIVDFSSTLAGPWASGLLAWMGAEVIKVESLRRVDTIRALHTYADGIPGINRSLFNSFNTDKLSCTIDLTRNEGIILAKRLVAISQAAAESFGYGVMEKLGLSYQALKEVKPDIVYISISGPGRSGPHKQYLCYGHTIHAYSGLTALVGYPGQTPRGMGITYVDPLTGVNGALALMIALIHQAATGEGQFIDLAMSETELTQLPGTILDATLNNRESGCSGNIDYTHSPNNCFPCKGDDKWVAISVTTEEEWDAFCQAIGHAEWISDNRFADEYLRFKYREVLDKSVADWAKNYTPYEATEILQKAGVPAGPVLSVDEVVNNKHLLGRDFFVAPDHPETGRRIVAGKAWHAMGQPGDEHRYAPLLGEHNQHVFGELLGLSSAEIKRLQEAEVIY